MKEPKDPSQEAVQKPQNQFLNESVKPTLRELLKDKVVVITGASSGFGKGAALKFAAEGANVVVAARRELLVRELADDCTNLGVRALAVKCDVSKPAEVQNLFERAIETFGTIDVWVNNAGAGAVGPFTDIPLAENIQVIETDLVGTICGSHFALNHFKSRGKGTLINVSSMIGKVPAPYYAAYSAAKHGVVGFSAALRQELSQLKLDDIHVCTVMPMAMDTPFFEHAANYSGHEVVPIPPLDKADKVIDVIVNLAVEPKGEVPVGMSSGTNVLMHNMAPPVSEKLMAKLTHKSQMEDAPPAPIRPGGLSQPANYGTEIHDPKIQKL